MGTIKKLTCPFKRLKGRHEWHEAMNNKLTDELNNYYKEVPVTVGSDGWYYQSGKCWYEFEGKAYSARAKDFIYQLGIISAGEYSKAEYLALKQLDRINSKLLTKDQGRFLFNYEQYLYCKKLKAKSLVEIRAMKRRVLGY